MQSWATAVPFRSGADHESLPAFVAPIGKAEAML